MPLDLSDTLVVGISATGLFDLEEEDKLFRELSSSSPDDAIAEYRKLMLERENAPLDPGTGFPLVRALLALDEQLPQAAGDSPLVEVVVMSRNSPDTGVRVLNSIRHHGLRISRSAFTGGEGVTDYLTAFDVDLFLTTNPADAQQVINSRVCAAAVVRRPPSNLTRLPVDQVRIAFDGDAVLFSQESELFYKQRGLKEFHQREFDSRDVPLPEGPYATLLKKLARLQERLPGRVEYSRVRLALVTARNSPADMRVINTFRAWRVYVDEAFFLGSVDKSKILAAFHPHIFFEDQDVHLDPASSIVPSGKVLYPAEPDPGARSSDADTMTAVGAEAPPPKGR